MRDGAQRDGSIECCHWLVRSDCTCFSSFYCCNPVPLQAGAEGPDDQGVNLWLYGLLLSVGSDKEDTEGHLKCQRDRLSLELHTLSQELS